MGLKDSDIKKTLPHTRIKNKKLLAIILKGKMVEMSGLKTTPKWKQRRRKRKLKYKFKIELDNRWEGLLSKKLQNLLDIESIKLVNGLNDKEIDLELKSGIELTEFLNKLEKLTWINKIESFTRQT